MINRQTFAFFAACLIFFACNPDPNDPGLPPYDYEGNWQLHSGNLSSTKNSMAYRADEDMVYTLYESATGDDLQKFSVSTASQLTSEASVALTFSPTHLIPASTAGVFVAGESSGTIKIQHFDANLGASWTQTLAQGTNVRPQDLVATSDGGLAVVARYLASYNSYPDYYLVRMDGNGDTLWSKWLNGANNPNSYALAAGPSGGLLVGMEENGGVLGTGSPKVVYLDASGNATWSKTFTTSDEDLQFISDISQSSNGDYLLVGETYEHGSILIRYDASGAEQWRLAGPSAGAIALFPTADDGFAVLGSSISEWIERQIEVWKVEANGSFTFTSTLGGPGTDNPGNLAQLLNGNFLISGLTNGFGGTVESKNHTFYIRVNDSGEIMD